MNDASGKPELASAEGHNASLIGNIKAVGREKRDYEIPSNLLTKSRLTGEPSVDGPRHIVRHINPIFKTETYRRNARVGRARRVPLGV